MTPLMKPQPANRRRLRIVDHSLQQSMLIALVLMETLIVAGAIWFLYRALADILDQNLYRVHFHGSVDMLSLLVRECTPVLGAMLALNFAALVAADRIWAHYVAGIVGTLARLMAAALRLDFGSREAGPFQHAVLDQAHAWRAAEAARLARARSRIRSLPDALPDDPAARAALAAALAILRHD